MTRRATARAWVVWWAWLGPAVAVECWRDLHRKPQPLALPVTIGDLVERCGGPLARELYEAPA